MITIDKNAVQIQYTKIKPYWHRKGTLKQISFTFPQATFQRTRWISLQEIIEYFKKNRPQKWQYGSSIYKDSIFTKKDIKNMKRAQALPLKVDYDAIKYGKQNGKQETNIIRVLKLDCIHCSCCIVVHQLQKLNLNTNELGNIIQIKSCFTNHIHEVTGFARKMLQKQVIQFITKNISIQPKVRIIDKLSSIYTNLTRNQLSYSYQKYVGRLLQTFQDIRQKYRKQDPQIYFQIFHQCKSQNKKTKQVIKFVQQQEQKIHKNNVILMVTPTMIENYKKYGDTISFDITYRLVRKFHQYSVKREQASIQQWGAGFFIGQNQNLRIVLLGVALIKNETADNFRQLFERFFTIMLKNGGNFPQTIVTDDQIALKRGLQELKTNNNFYSLKQIINQKLDTQNDLNQSFSKTISFTPNWLHLLDQFHKLQSLKRMMTQLNVGKEQQRTIILRAFAKLMKQNNQVIFRQKIEQLMCYFGDPKFKQIINSFLKQKERYCASIIGKKFFGFSVSSVKVEAFNSMIKQTIHFSTYPSNFFRKCLQIQSFMNLRNSNQLNPHFQPKSNQDKKLKNQGKFKTEDIPKQFLCSSYRTQSITQEQQQQYVNWNFDDKFVKRPESMFESLLPNKAKSRPVIGIEQLSKKMGKHVFKKLLQQIGNTQSSEGPSKTSETFIYTQSQYKQLSKLSEKQVQKIFRNHQPNAWSKLEQQRKCETYYVIQSQYAYKLKLINPGRGKGYRITQRPITFWLCQCNYIFHTGIPCCHLIALLRYRFESIIPYFKRRWFIDFNKNTNPKATLQNMQIVPNDDRLIEIQSNSEKRELKQQSQQPVQIFSLSKKRKANNSSKKKQKYDQSGYQNFMVVQDSVIAQQPTQISLLQQQQIQFLDDLEGFNEEIKHIIRMQLQKDKQNQQIKKLCSLGKFQTKEPKILQKDYSKFALDNQRQNKSQANEQQGQSIFALSNYRKAKKELNVQKNRPIFGQSNNEKTKEELNTQECKPIFALSKYRTTNSNLPDYKKRLEQSKGIKRLEATKRQRLENMKRQKSADQNSNQNKQIKRQIAAVFKMEIVDFQQAAQPEQKKQKKEVIHTVQRYKRSIQDLKQYEKRFKFDLDFNMQNRFKNNGQSKINQQNQTNGQNQLLNQQAQKLLKDFDFDMNIQIPNFLDQENQEQDQKDELLYKVQRLVKKANKNQVPFRKKKLQIKQQALRLNEQREQIIFRRHESSDEQNKGNQPQVQPFGTRVKRNVDKNFGYKSNFKMKFCVNRLNSLFQKRMNKMKQCRQVLDFMQENHQRQSNPYNAQCAQNLRDRIEKWYN